ncbi:acyl-CoA dehydrogenase family protein [Pseudarthrobacter raffinosi]|uniref:acyl-CoA dehydrogenase family protein n=1 Tax=Pseudarthrobacter raffinosi TaxID=2953651 RepID=UPI00208FF8C7|nr:MULTISPECIES: acyl-CoA dehydrogenase family protein [unclassified Pseudarthrobacter]MCO4237263.1 acyl-CoA dehydrogenase family protein [Pseudarthrobacter sp. MDT3-28]MCO4252767.1 acyl-CoA dehydrogenase family protein [Pseudarthrobacter sp. MDT3-9]MCO4264947.1 acyl-CoA dehydrogenase family protein [Pseudarthrobacter sp. MDT3-26]
MSFATDSPATNPPATEVPATDAPDAEVPVAAANIGPEATAADARALAEASRELDWDRPSFAKGLYLGNFDLSLIHPWPKANADDVVRGEAFMERLTAYARTMSGRVIEREARIPDEYLQGLAGLGVFGMKIPQEYGGLGLSLVYYGRALALLGSVHPSIGALISAHQSIGVPEPVKVFGTPDQKREYLPRCAAGAITAFLLTEPDVGSDPARMGSTAVPTDDGGSYVLDGVKLWTTNGVIAELVVVMAVVPAHTDKDGTEHKGGISAFVVEMDSPGITVENRNTFMGLRGIENGVTRFHQVRVPAANRLGREGQGLKIALTTLNTGRLSLPALCVASGRWSLKIAREWSNARTQWGQPVGKHEAVGKKIAFIAASAFALDAVFELSAELADAGQKDVRIEAALAKLWSSEISYRIADELVQIRGGRGFETAESLEARGERAVPAEQQLRDLRINRIFEGSSEIMKLLIAREAVDAHLAAAGDLASVDASLQDKARAAVGASGFYARWLPKLVAGAGMDPRSYSDFGRLAKQLRFVERSSRRLARQTFYGMGRWQAKLEYKQAFLGRVVDIGAELFAMAACCSRAEMILRTTPERAASAYELAEAYCEQARVRIDEYFDQLWRNTDDVDHILSRKVLAGDYTWLEAGVLDPSEGTGPWIADATPGASTKENLHRKYR